MRKFHDALEQFNTVLEIEPKHSMALYNKASCLTEFGDDDGALKIIDKMLEINSNDPSAFYAKHMILVKNKNYEEAWKYWYKHLDAKKLGRDKIDSLFSDLKNRFEH